MDERPVLVLQHVECEGLGLFRECLEARHVAPAVVALYRREPIPDPSDYRALLVMGGPMGVDDEDAFPYLKAEVGAIKIALRRRLPLLGVCLGAQLMAKALGAKVRRNRTREIGFHLVDLTPQGASDPLFRGLGPQLQVFQWHGDTFSIPRGATRLATSEACRNQAFRYGSTAYALQFHLEVTRDMVEDWARTYCHELESEATPRDKLFPPDLEARCAALRRDGEKLLDNFVKLLA